MATCKCGTDFDDRLTHKGTLRKTGKPRLYCTKQCKGRFANSPERALKYRLKRYGLTIAEYNVLLERQGGGCAICRKTIRHFSGRALHVDHCHETGKVRGILCTLCNPGLGYFQNDPDLLRAAITYLERV